MAKRSRDPRIVTAKMCANAFFDAWKAKDWAGMLDHSQITWREETENPALWLHSNFGHLDLRCYTILDARATGDCSVDVIASMKAYTAHGSLRLRGDARARVICEIGARDPSPDGTWGVNPISVIGGGTNGSDKPAEGE